VTLESNSAFVDRKMIDTRGAYQFFIVLWRTKTAESRA